MIVFSLHGTHLSDPLENVFALLNEYPMASFPPHFKLSVACMATDVCKSE